MAADTEHNSSSKYFDKRSRDKVSSVLYYTLNFSLKTCVILLASHVWNVSNVHKYTFSCLSG